MLKDKLAPYPLIKRLYIFFFLMATTLSLTQAQDASFELQLMDQGNAVQVTCRFQVKTMPFNVLFPDRFAGNSELYQNLSNIQVLSKQATVERMGDKGLTVRSSGPEFSIRYTIQLKKGGVVYTNFYEPFNKDGATHLVGAAAFAYVEGSGEESEFWISHTSSNDMQLYASCNKKILSDTAFQVNGLKDLHESLLLITNKEPSILDLENDRVYFFSPEKYNEAEQLETLVRKSLFSVRKFWGDSDANYLICVTLFDSLDQGISYRATCLKNGITVGFTGNLDPNTTQAQRLFAHELTHNWIGIKLRPPDPEENYYWYSEGFTEFIAWKILHDNQWIDTEEYVKHYNEVLRNVYLSKFRNSSLTEIQENFWKDREAQVLPYDKGSLFALQLDFLISQNSLGNPQDDHLSHLQPKLTLQHPLRQLLADKRPVVFSDSSFAEALQTFLPPDISYQALFEQVFVNGDDLQLPEAVFGEKYKIAPVPIGRFELGFEWDETTRLVSSVKPTSAAYEAGLRKGDSLSHYSINYTVDSLIELGISRQSGEAFSISFYPQSKNKIQVPQFIVR